MYHVSPNGQVTCDTVDEAVALSRRLARPQTDPEDCWTNFHAVLSHPLRRQARQVLALLQGRDGETISATELAKGCGTTPRAVASCLRAVGKQAVAAGYESHGPIFSYDGTGGYAAGEALTAHELPLP